MEVVVVELELLVRPHFKLIKFALKRGPNILPIAVQLLTANAVVPSPDVT